MPIIVDPQKLSMPEQVQQNKKDIENIYKIIDGLDSLDNVVEVSDMSYILTAQELKAIEQPVAFIIYNNKVYLKRKIESGIAYFDRVFSISGSTVLTFDSEEIQATLSNGALAMISNSVFTYSKSEIDNKFSTITYVDNQLALKANLSGANFTGAITSPSIIEEMSGYSFNKGSELTGITREFVYAGGVKNGNKLTLVLALNITRTATVSNNLPLGQFYMPSDIMGKLYPTNVGGYNFLDNKVIPAFSDHYTKEDIFCFVQKIGSSYVFLQADPSALNNLTLNTKYYLRYEITFLLSENLAE